jgi:uncharacterized protein (UPF0335 family)
MSIKLMMEVNRAHERLDEAERREAGILDALVERIAKLENEIKAMKARAGKVREVAEI